MTHGVTIFKQQENWQACYECTLFHPTKPIHHKHPPVKWRRPCSLMMRNPCFWASNHVTKSMQNVTVKCFKSYIWRSRTDIRVKSLWQRCVANNPHLFVMQSLAPTKYHTVEGAPTFWTCHLAIKWHTCAVNRGVQENKVQ